ncbi:AAA family ATPase [Luteibaculum oceani]|uniref:MoxR family ATPase n=1 Tax=Luteibaculum oceani TaxID=1294296 RepID=A0A5C6V9G1_9FLAO|nr:MoxR family ATPase [Luteibaculum oceani]TXC81370.1 MoxR family ATPase [Luteibaculum oceani]
MSNPTEQVKIFLEKSHQLKQELSKVIVGQDEVIQQVLISIFSKGHCLLVGVPGLAKTLLVNSISQALGLSFNRIQFTPDLMPSDITGSEILDENKKFQFIKGPIFSNVVLADEINRTPPKTQSALLEAMQEKKVTYGGKTLDLPNPFFVLATQNPIEQEGTYPLPEAQLDRFMFNIWVDYPSFSEELEIVKRTTGSASATINPVFTQEDILASQNLVRQIPVTDTVFEYAVKLVGKTRLNQEGSELAKSYLSWGAGPRASQYLILGAKAHALLNGKFAPDIEDVKAVAAPVLRHRIITNYKAEAAGYTVDSIIQELL